VADRGHPTMDTFLIRPRFWEKVAQHDKRGCTVLQCTDLLSAQLNVSQTKRIDLKLLWFVLQ